MPRTSSLEQVDVPLLTLLPLWSPFPMLLRRKFIILQVSSMLAELPLQQTKCLCALCAQDAMVRTFSIRPSLLTQIWGYYYWCKLKVVALMKTSPSTIFFLSFICHLCLHLCFTISPLFPSFTLLLVLHSLSWPYPLIFTILHAFPLCLWPMCFFPLLFRFLLFEWPSKSTTNPPSLIVLEWKVTILLKHAQQVAFSPFFVV
jgi:hypothetical protein